MALVQACFSHLENAGLQYPTLHVCCPLLISEQSPLWHKKSPVSWLTNYKKQKPNKQAKQTIFFFFFRGLDKETPFRKRHFFWRADAVLSQGSWLDKWSAGRVSAPWCFPQSGGLVQGASSTGSTAICSSCASGMLRDFSLKSVNFPLMGVSGLLVDASGPCNLWRVSCEISWMLTPFPAQSAPGNCRILGILEQSCFPTPSCPRTVP